MHFWEWKSAFETHRELGVISRDERPADFYERYIAHYMDKGDLVRAVRMSLERDWYRDRRPYYNVYPGIVPMLMRLRLDVPCTLIRPPMETLHVRFSKTHSPLSFAERGQSYSLRGVFMVDVQLRGGARLEFWLDVGRQDRDGVNRYVAAGFDRNDNRSVEEACGLDDPPAECDVPPRFAQDAMRLLCSICLLSEDPDLIQPDVLSCDRENFEKTLDPKYVQKARQGGKVGWNVGRTIEMVPHYRRPHLALFWTGPGRTVPKIGPRKGSIVRRTRIGDIPTGWMDSEKGV